MVHCSAEHLRRFVAVVLLHVVSVEFVALIEIAWMCLSAGRR